MDFFKLADKVVQGETIIREECLQIIDCPGDMLLELLYAGFHIRKNYFGRKVSLHLLVNAKSGLCTEDCAYCSQSAISQASVDRYPLLDEDAIVEGAYTAQEAGAKRYCIVSSGRTPHGSELRRIGNAVQRIKGEMEIEVCTSLGFLTLEEAKALKESGVDRYNHNLNASERFYPEICSTHSYEDRILTIRNARAAGMELCCGALFGMGENKDDIIDTAFTLQDIAPDSIPINFFHPVPGTPLIDTDHLTPFKCLVILCLIRFLNPQTEIRVAGGREYHLRSLQPMALYPANSLFVSGYLTTPGQTPKQTREMIQDLGFEVEEERSMEIAARPE